MHKKAAASKFEAVLLDTCEGEVTVENWNESLATLHSTELNKKYIDCNGHWA